MSDSDNPPPSPGSRLEEDAGTPREVLVVSFQTDTRYGDDPGGLVHFPVRAARVTKQAEALGGKLCAFGPLAFSFAFPGDDLEDPIAWAAEVAIREGAVPKLSVGISHGELASIVEPQALLAIGWGRALVVASALAASAHLGEILVDPEIPDVLQTVRATLVPSTRTCSTARWSLSVENTATDRSGINLLPAVVPTAPTTLTPPTAFCVTCSVSCCRTCPYPETAWRSLVPLGAGW